MECLHSIYTKATVWQPNASVCPFLLLSDLLKGQQDDQGHTVVWQQQDSIPQFYKQIKN